MDHEEIFVPKWDKGQDLLSSLLSCCCEDTMTKTTYERKGLLRLTVLRGSESMTIMVRSMTAGREADKNAIG